MRATRRTGYRLETHAYKSYDLWAVHLSGINIKSINKIKIENKIK